jgi:hypothetical protein
MASARTAIHATRQQFGAVLSHQSQGPAVMINYAQALRTLGQRAQAASVLEQRRS